MAMVSGQIRSSTLNPNAPLFVPAAYRQVEDFSPEWWQLVKSSTWFRDYWLSEHPEGIFDGSEDVDDDDVYLPENLELENEFEEMVSMDGFDREAFVYAAFGPNDFVRKSPNVDVKTLVKDISVPKYGKEASPIATSPKSPNGMAKYQMKLAQRVSPKSALRRIQQPR